MHNIRNTVYISILRGIENFQLCIYYTYVLYSPHPPKPLPLPLTGLPALFLPGNAGSYKQARSSASIALRMHASEFSDKKWFDFFAVNFNEV